MFGQWNPVVADQVRHVDAWVDHMSLHHALRYLCRRQVRVLGVFFDILNVKLRLRLGSENLDSGFGARAYGLQNQLMLKPTSRWDVRCR